MKDPARNGLLIGGSSSKWPKQGGSFYTVPLRRKKLWLHIERSEKNQDFLFLVSDFFKKIINSTILKKNNWQLLKITVMPHKSETCRISINIHGLLAKQCACVPLFKNLGRMMTESCILSQSHGGEDSVVLVSGKKEKEEKEKAIQIHTRHGLARPPRIFFSYIW